MKKKEEKPAGVGGRAEVSYNVDIVLRGPDGKIKDERHIKNLMVNAGLNAGIKQIIGSGDSDIQPTEFNYAAIGDDNTAATATDTALGNELGTRVQDTVPDFPSTGVGKLICLFAAGNGTGTIRESGVFNASSSGTMLARTTFSDITKGAGDELQVTWQFTLA